MRNKQKGFVSLIIIIAILVIGGAGFFYYKSQKSLTANKPIEETILVDKELNKTPKIESTNVSQQIPNINPNENKQKICEQDGGKWTPGEPQYGGQRCIKTYADAGKKCTNSNQCLGGCVTNIVSNLGKEGTCQKSNDRELCFNPIENKRFECLLGDIMFNCDSQKWDFQCDGLLKDKVFFK